MPSPATLAYWEGLVLIVGLGGVVVWKLAAGEIPLDDLFEGYVREDDGTSTSQSSTGRVQCFLVTMAVAVYFVSQVIQDPHQFPQIPSTVVGLLAASHAGYLGSKAHAMLPGLRNMLSRRTP
jgi:hypothetical protein